MATGGYPRATVWPRNSCGRSHAHPSTAVRHQRRGLVAFFVPSADSIRLPSSFRVVVSTGVSKIVVGDLPLFRIKDHRLRRCNRGYSRCSRTAMNCYRLSCTNMNETKTETRANAHIPLRSGILPARGSCAVCPMSAAKSNPRPAKDRGSWPPCVPLQRSGSSMPRAHEQQVKRRPVHRGLRRALSARHL